MLNTVIEIIPLEPLMMRDARKFSRVPGVRARTLNEVPPSALSGTLRTMFFKHNEDLNLKKIAISGPLYRFQKRLFVPVPRDVAFYEDVQGKLQACYYRPQVLQQGAGFLGIGNEFRHEDMWPAIAPKLKGKPAQKVPAFVSMEWMAQYLAGSLTEEDWEEPLAYWRANLQNLSDAEPNVLHFLPGLIKDERTHTAIEPGMNKAEEGRLFSTEGLVFPPGMSMVAQIKGWQEQATWEDTVHSFGGKRRLAQFRTLDMPSFPKCPKSTRKALALTRERCFVQMVLATPAYFDRGWLPRWLDTDLITNERAESIVGKDVRLKLHWAILPRWTPISGWSYPHQAEKSVRRMVPAGSVYFFEILEGDGGFLARESWLISVSDHNRRKGAFDREDGFGLAMWGVWKPSEC